MKRTGLIIAMICIMAGVSLTAMASDEKSSFPNYGIDLSVTQELEELKGLLLPYPIGAIDEDRHIFALGFVYEGMPKEEASLILNNPEPSAEDIARIQEVQVFSGLLLVSDGDPDTTRETGREVLGEAMGLDFDHFGDIASGDGFTFYYVPLSDAPDLEEIMDAEYAQECAGLEQMMLAAFQDSDFYAPVDPVAAMNGQKLSFTTTDLDGNTVTSEELFSGNEITMVNCWGVWCINCVNEMEELAAMHTRLQEKGCGIVGLEWEKEQGEEIEQKARDMMEEWGTNYPNALLPDELLEQIDGFPTTFFVDRDGNILDTPIVGAAVGRYESALESLLDGEKAEPAAGTDAPDADGAAALTVYHVSVTDEEGPVEGVMIQMCDDTSCRFEETDEDGTADFEGNAGTEYEVHVMEVPDGYQEDDTVYHTTDGSNELNIQIQKEE